jgi:hypothetical protein
MFTSSPNDLAVTLDKMIDAAKPAVQYDIHAAERQVAAWVKQDRRFDHIGMSAAEVAKEAFECRQSGRQIRLGPKPYEPHSLPPTYTGR